MTTMFKISEEDFALGDEDFWCEALSDEATESLSSKPLNVQEDSDVKKTGSPATYNQAYGEKSRIPTIQKGSSPNFIDVSGIAMTPKDPNIRLDVSTSVTSANLPKRKFCFKPKSPKGGWSIPVNTVEQGIISTSKRVRLNDSTCTPPVNNSNLQVGFGSIELRTVQDKSKNTQREASILRPISNHVGVSPNFSQPAVTLNASVETHAKTKNTNNATSRSTLEGDSKRMTPQEKQLRNTMTWSQTPATTQSNQTLNMQGKQFNSEVKTIPEIVSDERIDNFDEQFNLWEDDFDWDSVTVQPSTSVTKNVSKEESKSRSANTATSQPSTTINVKLDCNISQPGSFQKVPAVAMDKNTHQRPIINFEQLSDQERCSEENEGMTHVVHKSSASARPSTSYGSNTTSYPTHVHRTNLPHPVQEPISHKKTSHTIDQQLQGNPPRTNFLPHTPTPSYPNQRSSTPFQLRTGTPLRPGTSGCRPASFHNKDTPQGVSSTPSIMNQNSSTRHFTPVQRFNSPANSSHYTGNQGGRPFSTHGSKPQSTVVTTPQTPLLTSRVAQLFQTPTIVKTARLHTRVRKFPGPAGVLPKLMEGQKLNELSEIVSPETAQDVPTTSSTKPKFIPSEDDGEADFSHGAWKRMKVDLDLDDDSQHSILAKNNIALLLRKASLKQLTKNKVPHLCVMIKSITMNTDASVVLRDPTGEMQGTIHRRLMEEHQAELKPGSVLVLRQVGVLSPSLRNHYLNITPSNLIQVYPSESTLYQSSQQHSSTPKSSNITCKKFACPGQSTLENSERIEVMDRVDSAQVKLHDGQIVVGGSVWKERNNVNAMESNSLVNPVIDSGALMALKVKDASTSEHLQPRKHNQNDAIMVLNENAQPSNHNGHLQGEDFTELLADIGDEFFDDF